jgi:hypothetical protein
MVFRFIIYELLLIICARQRVGFERVGMAFEGLVLAFE